MCFFLVYHICSPYIGGIVRNRAWTRIGRWPSNSFVYSFLSPKAVVSCLLDAGSPVVLVSPQFAICCDMTGPSIFPTWLRDCWMTLSLSLVRSLSWHAFPSSFLVISFSFWVSQVKGFQLICQPFNFCCLLREVLITYN